ncbi:MAG: hypothetical protein JW895_18070 [Thermoleophilaceae bacterium]|nr:hypothetical protein [Thermoleophilaceae bacterium]
MQKASAVCATFAIACASAGPAAAGEPLAPLEITSARVDAQRHVFVSWAPAWPLVNIAVTTRPVRRPDGEPARRYQVQGGFMGSLPPQTSWRVEDPLIPGEYHVSISGDAAFRHSPATPFEHLAVKARRGEWTGSTSQSRYIRLRHPGPRVLDGTSFSVWGGEPDGCYVSFALPRIWVRPDGSFSAHFPSAHSRQTEGDVRISGRVRDRFARGTLRVTNMFEGCRTKVVSWSARKR